MATVALLAMLALAAVDAAGQPSIEQILPSITQLGEGWSSNRVVVLVDPLSSPSEWADVNEGPGWLKLGRELLKRDPRREAWAVIRYFGRGTGAYHTNSLVTISRWKAPESIGKDWGRDNETKGSPAELPNLGEETRFYQRDGMHNDIAFRRGNYLINVECPIAFGVEHLKRLAETLDANLVRAQKALRRDHEKPAAQK
jgi:hypothetical protein